MKAKRILVLTMAAVMALGMLAACAPSATPAPAGASTKKPEDITIAVVPKALDNPIFLDAKTGAEAAGADLGIKIEWVGSTNSVAADQVTVIEGLIEKGVDGMMISCNDADALKDVINRAIEKGIKVATFDSDSADSNRLFYIGTNNYNAGKQAAEFLMEIMPDGGKVAILTGVLGAPNLEERILGFKETAEGSKLEILPIQSGDDDVAKSVEVVNQFTAANPDLAAWFFDGGWPFFADEDALVGLKSFREKGGKVISIDTFHPMLKFVELDYTDKLIGQNYLKMGDEGVRLLYKAIQGETIAEKIIDTGFEYCDKSNVAELLASKTPW